MESPSTGARPPVDHGGDVGSLSPPALPPAPLTRLTHYTDSPSRLSATSDHAITRVHGGGFVTCEMLEQTIADVRHAATRPGGMLVDLRDVAGYEASCLRPARQFLRDAPSLGVARIALIASSSVLRTATRLAASSAGVELRTFEHEPHAQQWLDR